MLSTKAENVCRTLIGMRLNKQCRLWKGGPHSLSLPRSPPLSLPCQLPLSSEMPGYNRVPGVNRWRAAEAEQARQQPAHSQDQTEEVVGLRAGEVGGAGPRWVRLVGHLRPARPWADGTAQLLSGLSWRSVGAWAGR